MLRVLILLVAFYCYPQSHVGVASERYSGFNGTAINPTSFINSPIDQEINLFGIDFQFDSDYGFIKNSSYLNLSDVFSNIKVTNPFTDVSIDDFSININKSNIPYSILSSFQINGPSYIFKFNKNEKIFAFGLGVNQRVNISSLEFNSGYNYNNFRKENFGNEILFDQANSKLYGANWSEVKLNFAYTKENKSSVSRSFGVNFKINIPYTSIQINQESPVKMIYKDLDTMIFFNDFKTETSYFLDAEAPFKKRGFGFAFDLGYSIFKKKAYSKDKHSYIYKLGFSVLDLGFLNFNKLTEVHNYEILGLRELDIKNVANYRDMSDRVYGDANKSFKDNSFKLFTPSALSIQFDYNFFRSFYFNTTIINRLIFGDKTLIRPNILNSSLRIEKRKYSLILSSTLYEYEKVMIGLSSRLGPLYFSIDNISNMLFKKNKLNHVEFMFGVKIYPFYKKNSNCICLNWFSKTFNWIPHGLL